MYANGTILPAGTSGFRAQHSPHGVSNAPPTFWPPERRLPSQVPTGTFNVRRSIPVAGAVPSTMYGGDLEARARRLREQPLPPRVDTPKSALLLMPGTASVSAPSSVTPTTPITTTGTPATPEDARPRTPRDENTPRERHPRIESREELELRQRVSELELDNVRLTAVVAEQTVATSSELLDRLEVSEAGLFRERQQSKLLREELDQARAEALCDAGKPVPCTLEEIRDQTLEALREELAKRDGELLVAVTARRRCADEAARTAATLRTKLAELESAVATPSVSSRASSQSRERGLKVLCAKPRASSVGQAVQERHAPPRSASWSARSRHWRAREHQDTVAAELFQRIDVQKRGVLSWRSGDVMLFLEELSRTRDQPLPKLPSAVFSSFHAQVKGAHRDSDVLNVVEASELFRKLQDLCARGHDDKKHGSTCPDRSVQVPRGTGPVSQPPARSADRRPRP